MTRSSTICTVTTARAGSDRATMSPKPTVVNTATVSDPIYRGSATNMLIITPNLWSSTGLMSVPREYHPATLLLNGKVLVAGGGGQNGPLDSAELYDPGTGSWTAAGNMITGRYGHTATLLPDGRVLVAGNNNDRPELYDPGSGN